MAKSTVKERLDRVVCSSSWRMTFQEASMVNLALPTSDHSFCEESGQLVNGDKSKIFFSQNTNLDSAKEISSFLSMDLTEPWQLPCFPIVNGRITRETYSSVIDKVKQKLAGWKANSLSMAGRITLAQAAVMSIPNYLMQAFVFPTGVSWSKICQPKKDGGLGFKSLKMVNEAYVIKLGWRMVNQPNLLWFADMAPNGVWNIQIFQDLLPADIIDKLHAVNPPRENLEVDAPSWIHSYDGNFHMKDIYANLAAANTNSPDEELCKSVGIGKVPLEYNASCGNVFMVSFLPMKKDLAEVLLKTLLAADVMSILSL
ncbi:hypothetical protein SESBI_12746 [Sesbania bispinosa]|nr:hypothetical protein SESBI_12746 [Sesbania bispinosa]